MRRTDRVRRLGPPGESNVENIPSLFYTGSRRRNNNNNNNNNNRSSSGNSNNPNTQRRRRPSLTTTGEYPEALPSLLARKYNGPVEGTAVIDQDLEERELAESTFEMVSPPPPLTEEVLMNIIAQQQTLVSPIHSLILSPVASLTSIPSMSDHRLVPAQASVALAEAPGGADHLLLQPSASLQQHQHLHSDVFVPSPPQMNEDFFVAAPPLPYARGQLGISPDALSGGGAAPPQRVVKTGGYVIFSDDFVENNPSTTIAAVTQDFRVLSGCTSPNAQTHRSGDTAGAGAAGVVSPRGVDGPTPPLSPRPEQLTSPASSASPQQQQQQQQQQRRSSDLPPRRRTEEEEQQHAVRAKVHKYISEVEAQERPLFRRINSEKKYGRGFYYSMMEAEEHLHDVQQSDGITGRSTCCSSASSSKLVPKTCTSPPVEPMRDEEVMNEHAVVEMEDAQQRHCHTSPINARIVLHSPRRSPGVTPNDAAWDGGNNNNKHEV